MATLTGAIGTGSKWLLDKIVGVLAATGVNPNFLTFLGLVVNFVAAANFALGNFRIGALIIFFAGFLDILDGQVARRQNRVTAFGAFYDSTLDRYADMALYMGLLVYYCGERANVLRGACGGSDGGIGDGQLRARARGVAHSAVQSRLHGAAGTAGVVDYRRAVNRMGAGALGDCRGFHDHGDSPHRFHLAGNQGRPDYSADQTAIRKLSRLERRSLARNYYCGFFSSLPRGQR